MMNTFQYSSACKYPTTPYAINAIPKMMVINIGLFAANTAMNKITIPNTKPTNDPMNTSGESNIPPTIPNRIITIPIITFVVK